MDAMQILIDTFIQLLVFSLIPLVWYFFTPQKEDNFINWIGLKKPKILNRTQYISILIIDTVLLLVTAFIIIPMFLDDADLATSDFTGQGLAALVPALIYSFIQTGLAEEIFFRGFLAKRFINKFGMIIGNIIQALLFGLVHGLIFLPYTTYTGVFVITFITGFTGFLLGLLNEKYSNGSIVSSWLVHGITNLITSLFAMYNLL